MLKKRGAGQLSCALGPGFKEAGGRLVSLVVACSTENHWILGSEKLKGGYIQCSGRVLICKSLDSGFREAGGRLVSAVVACSTANHWVLGSEKLEGV